MAENYPTWDQIEKKLRQFWQDSYPREKIVELKQTKKELELGTEKVENSVVEYQHVYYYADETVTKPDGGKYLYPMRIAYYQVPGQPQWNFNYATPFGDHKVLEKGAGEDPLKLTPEKALDIVKKYVEIMMQKYFPPAKWKDYCAANSVEVKVNKVGFKDQPDQVQRDIDDINSKIQLDPSQSFRTSITIDGQYKDNTGSFKFRLQNLFPDLYVNLDQAFWTLSRDKTPVDQLTPADFSGLKDKLLETSEEPRKALEQWIPEASPLEKALALMMDPDANKRCEGIDELKWIQGVENDEMVVDTLIGLLNDPDQAVINYANSALDNIFEKTTNEAIKKKAQGAGDQVDQALAKLKSEDPNVRIQACEVLYSYAKDIADDVGVVNALLYVLQMDQNAQVAGASYKVLEKIKFQTTHPGVQEAMKVLDYWKCCWMLRRPEEAGTAWTKINKDILKKDERTMFMVVAIVQQGAGLGYSTRAIQDIKAWLDQVRAYDKDKISPELLAKINEVIGAPSTGPKDKAAPSAQPSSGPSQQVDEYAQAVANLKEKSKATDALKKIKSKREYNERIVKDDAAMESLINIWLKKGEFDSSTRSDVRSFLDSARSYQKDKLSPDVLKKIEEAFKTMRS